MPHRELRGAGRRHHIRSGSRRAHPAIGVRLRAEFQLPGRRGAERGPARQPECPLDLRSVELRCHETQCPVNQYAYDTNRTQIAIVGMACRLPGDTNTPAVLWQLLVEGRGAVEPRFPDRMEPGMGAGAVNAENGSEHLRTGGYLRDVAGFDADFFGVSRREADVLDPQHRLLLEVSWEALEHAGIPPAQLEGTSTGVFAGMSYNEYMDILAGQPQDLEGSVLTNGHCVASGRISYLLGLHGPSVTLDTACSSSLVAVHLASQALRAGECDLALAAGVTLILGDRATKSFARMGMLSPTARCRWCAARRSTRMAAPRGWPPRRLPLRRPCSRTR